MNEIRTLDLFSGIGGFALGLRRAGGFRTVAYCEIEPYCQEVLRARMRDGSLDIAPICTDVRSLAGEPWRGRVDLICGGFPCQDVSIASPSHQGLDGERSGLWSEIRRLVREIQPRYVIVENVPALLARGLGRVLGELAEIGYDAEWDCLPARAAGAPHTRDRVWIVAYPNSGRWSPLRGKRATASPEGASRRAPVGGGRGHAQWEKPIRGAGEAGGLPSDPNGAYGQVPGQRRWERWQGLGQGTRDLSFWQVEPMPPGVVDGIPQRLERLRAVGNSVVPQVVEWIGRRLKEQEPSGVEDR